MPRCWISGSRNTARRRIRRSTFFTCRRFARFSNCRRADQLRRAIKLLQVSVPYERGTPPSAAPFFFGAFYTVYVRGLAYLMAGQGQEAAAEFQKIIEGRVIVVSDPIGALAHYQLGKALAMSHDTAKAKIAYEDFFGLWNGAETNIPVMRRAREEYTELR